MRRNDARFIPIFLCIICFCFAFAFSETIPKTGVINDEAVELLQSQDLPTNQFYYFVPSYQEGHVDFIESFVPYVNKLIRTVCGPELLYIHLFYALCYAISGAIFFQLLRELFKNISFAAFGTFLLAGSAYANFFNRILTRNGISLFWTSLLLFIIWRILRHPFRPSNNSLYWLIWLPLVITLAVLTYTSFKFVAAAIFLTLGIWAISTPQRALQKRQEMLKFGLSLIITMTLLFLLLFLSHTPIRTAIFRGGYVLKGFYPPTPSRYLSHLVSSLLLPIYFKPGGDFLIEVTHTAYNRQTLSIFLAPFFILGVWNSLPFKKSGFGFQQLVLGIWILGTAMLALGGPQLKHHFALFPMVMFLVVCGLWQAAEWLTLIFRPRSFNIVAAVFLLAVVGGETDHLFRKIPLDGLLRLDSSLPAAVAREALQQAQAVSKVYLIEGWGRDAVRFYTRRHPNIRYILNHPPIPVEMENDLQAHQTIAIVTDREAAPEFFADQNTLSPACFHKQVSPGEGWVVTTYLSKLQCCDDENLP